jgi:hypothetical protein
LFVGRERLGAVTVAGRLHDALAAFKLLTEHGALISLLSAEDVLPDRIAAENWRVLDSSRRALFSSRLTAEKKLMGYGVIKGDYYNRTHPSGKIMLALYSGRCQLNPQSYESKSINPI